MTARTDIPPLRRGGGRVTMATVGKIAGVSQVTVSRALSDPSKVSATTLRKIHDAIDITGFVPNAIAGALASSRSQLVTALVPSVTNVMYSALIKAFGARLREAGYQILLSETGFGAAEEETLIRAHLSRRPDAMLLTGIHHSAQTRRMLLGAGIPVVEVWDLTDTPIDICVGFSHVNAGRAVAGEMRARGHAQAAAVTAADERARRRRDAFVAEFEALGGDRVAIADQDGEASLAGGRAAFAALIDSGRFTRGVVYCSSDVLAQGVMIEARARGLRAPEDVAVVGFGDQEFAAHLDPPLTSVRVDRAAIGRRAAEEVLARLRGATPGAAQIDVGFEIVHRGTA